MTNKFKLTFFSVITALTINSCGKTEKDNSKIVDTKVIVNDTNKQIKEQKSSINIGGTYSFGDDVEKGPVGSVKIYPLTNNTALFYLDVCRGAPSYNQGQFFGQMTIKDNIGIFSTKDEVEDLDCILKFEFSKEQLKIATEPGHDNCGFGGNVYADNIYYLIDKSNPKYFIEPEGDTIIFKGLTVEKYEKRFE